MLHNLLSSPPASSFLADVFRRHGPRSPLPEWRDGVWREAFANAALAPLREAILGRERAERDEPLPELTDALYRDCAATGNRLNFEKVYFERRRRLGRCAAALLAAGPGAEASLRAAFVAKLESIFSEASWALTAHVYHNPTGRDPRVLDLFAAETAVTLAECVAIFGDLVPDGLRAGIRERLRRDVFENYLAGDFFWLRITNNWNAVCHQGVLGAAMALEEDAELLARMWTKALAALPRFLEGFGADGASSEGPSYWDYGFGWFSRLNRQLEARTGGELSLFEGHEKIRAIAGYGPAMCLRGGALVNFADCAPGAALRASTLADLGERLGDASCLAQAGANYARLAGGPVALDAQRPDFLCWVRAFFHARAIRFGEATAMAGAPAAADAFFPSLGVWVARGRDGAGHEWELAAKGGRNDEHHNHNDLGSFILNVDGVRLIAEIGLPEYTAAYFSPARYEFLAARTLGHSLPIINGREQAAGGEFFAVVRRGDTGALVAEFEAELAGAYPAEANCEGFSRRLVLDKAGGVCAWRDTIRLRAPGAVESAVIVLGSEDDGVVIESPEVLLIRRGGLALELRVEGGAGWLRVETHGYAAPDGAPAVCRRAVLGWPADGGAPGRVVFESRVEMRLRGDRAG